MKLVDSKGMKEIDRKAQKDYGFPELVLMENAGIEACLTLEKEIRGAKVEGGLVVFVAGGGNNGGDTLVMARQYLNNDTGGKTPQIIYPKLKNAEGVHQNICRTLGIPSMIWERETEKVREKLKEAAVLVDGLTGTGIKGPLSSDLAELVEVINKSPCLKVALDVPSGISDTYRKGDPAVKADITLSIGLPKSCHYLPAARPLCGRIEQIKIGFPEALITDPNIPGELLTMNDLPEIIPPLHPSDYKNPRGVLAVYGGSPGTSGAGILAASAAGRSRAGLVTLFIDEGCYQAAAAVMKSIMVQPVSYPGYKPEVKGFTAFLAGPGWGKEGRRDTLKELLSTGLPGVLDADALELYRDLGPGRRETPLILTPHPGEMSVLTGTARDEILADPLTVAKEYAKKSGAVITLKSHIVYVVSPAGRYSIIDGMNPALGTGGTGDLLAGITAGLLSAGIPVYDAARGAALIHQHAGRIGYKEKGLFLAEDLLPIISVIAAKVT
ncbi:MAG: NAD(P)H-hydrate dehydratase [Spirochaetales bacterium]|nr:NAD(P)H-hydrate dehydratase [Spirochaetales bacterium]